MFDEHAFIVQLPTVIKARQDGERRLVEICASKEVVDGEGDIILQSALLGSAASFVKHGHLDLEHVSEVGERYGVARPSDYIVGNPIEVKDLGDGMTGVLGELRRGNIHANEIWDGLNSTPPVRWQASIYGFPHSGGFLDARVSKSEDMMGATRYLVKGIDWRSLAFTRSPVNASVGCAHVYTAKAFITIMKARLGQADTTKADNGLLDPQSFILPPRNRIELMGHFLYHMKGGQCPACRPPNGPSVSDFRQHFVACCNETESDADIKALALMQLLKHQRGQI